MAMQILAGARAEVGAHATAYDHRYFFAGPPESLQPVLRAVSGIALAALVEVIRSIGMHDKFLDPSFLSACMDAQNPVVKGFLVEHAVLSAIRANGLKLPDGTKFSGPLDVVQYRDVESVAIVASPSVLYVPTAFNEKDVDVVLRCVGKKGRVTIVALQITIGTISRHAHSVRFFTNGQDARWVQGVVADAVQRSFVWVVPSAEARAFRDKHVPGNRQPGRSGQTTKSQFEQHSLAIRDLCPLLTTL
eukprot:Opistho-2@92525